MRRCYHPPMTEPVRVVSLLPLGEEIQAKIRAVDDRVRLHVVGPEANQWLRIGSYQPPDPETTAREILAAVSDAEVWFTFRWGPFEFPSDIPLRWIQLSGAGADLLLRSPIPSQVTITNTSGLSLTPIGEWVLSFMLMHAKQMPLALQQQGQRLWKRYQPTMLRNATVGIVGLGVIGGEVARLSKAFGARVVATKRSARAGDRADHCDQLYPLTELRQLLAESDYVVLAMPLTSETHAMIGPAQFAAMKPGAALINIARGAVVDWQAMLTALRTDQIAAVYTDVTAPEPLPDGHDDWATPNLFITPHHSGVFPDFLDKAAEYLVANLRRYIDGAPLHNVVNRELGY